MCPACTPLHRWGKVYYSLQTRIAVQSCLLSGNCSFPIQSSIWIRISLLADQYPCVWWWWWWWWWGGEGLKPHQFQLFLRETMHAYYYNYCGKDLNVAHQLLNQGFIQIFCTALQRSGLVRTVGACAQRVASIPQTTELELETHFVE